MREFERRFTFETVQTGEPQDFILKAGIRAAICWLQEREGRSVSSFSTYSSRSPGPSQTMKTSTPQPSVAGQEYGATDYNTRDLPRIKSAQDDALLTRIDFILGSDESAINRIRWSPGRKCPDVLTLWCVGLSVSGGAGQGEVKRARDFRDATGPIGETVVDGIASRSKLSQFGEWPLFFHRSYSDPLLLAGSEKNLSELASKGGADCVVHLSVEISFVGLNRVRRSSIVAKVIDLHGDIPEWQSEKLSSRTSDEASTSEFSEAVLLQIDEDYLLEPVNESLVNRNWVMGRVRDLLQQRKSDALVTPPLSFLCELRYYLARDLITKEEGEKTCELFFGPGSWNRLFEGDWEKRMSAFQLAKFMLPEESPSAAP